LALASSSGSGVGWKRAEAETGGFWLDCINIHSFHEKGFLNVELRMVEHAEEKVYQVTDIAA
jgi:hypothetical protein